MIKVIKYKSACSGFKLDSFGRGPTHFGCGPGFPKNRKKLGNTGKKKPHGRT